MKNLIREAVERHIKTHSESSDRDHSAVSSLEYFFKSNGKINTNFSAGDKWPNTDGTFEFVIEPSISRSPVQNFFVQIKGTNANNETDNLKYSLQNLAFPAFIYCDVTLDPGILFVVFNRDKRGEERVFWRYMSVDFVNSIDYKNNSVTITFTLDEEIKNTDESVNVFCDKLTYIISHHSFVKQLDNRNYSKKDIERIIKACDDQITEGINRVDIIDVTRDDISKRILNRLYDLCDATLRFNALNSEFEKVSTRLAYEKSLLSIETKYLGTFLRSLKYIGNRIPDNGQSERLILKYYNFLWQIRKFLYEKYEMKVLHNLEKFPLDVDETDRQYYKLVANAVDSIVSTSNLLGKSRFHVQKTTPFFIGKERYYEVTLQLAGIYATKYNRITAYSKADISTNYSVQVGYTDAMINLWGVDSQIKVITNWQVSIDPYCLNKLAKVLYINTRLNSFHGEYVVLMNFLTKTGINLLDLIDLQEVTYSTLVDQIYRVTNTSVFKEVLLKLKNNYSVSSKKFGRHVVRYLLLELREEVFERVMPNYSSGFLCEELDLSSRCRPFEMNPFISNLAGSKTSGSNYLQRIAGVAGDEKIDIVTPYLSIKNAIAQTGEIYFEANSILNEEAITKFNFNLDSWERKQGHLIKQEDGFVCIESYENKTIRILQILLRLSCIGNKGQREFNKNFIEHSMIDFSDPSKKKAMQNAFVDSQLLMIYGAAGTGKTMLINYISNMMTGRRKLFLTKTHTALQNLKRRIDNPGMSADFVSINSFTKKVDIPQYDIIFIDECSSIDNRTILSFLEKMSPNTFLVLAGDIYQIESIDFGNWFFYAKEIINTNGANVELVNTWRTKDEALISLWNEIRNQDELITEKLVIDGPFSEDIGSKLLEKEEDDEVVLCLNYDGKFGLNNINNYFQNVNKNEEAVIWQEWSYKVGDPILFNDTKRFSVLYNNLKGQIVGIEKQKNRISFTIDVETLLTEMDCQRDGLEFICIKGNSTCIRFIVYDYDATIAEEEAKTLRMKSIIPFQLAYAVSIHKAQGLEYDSVKVVIPRNNSEKITHGIFYTAITRAKKKLKIYWSSETMKEIVEGFSADEPKRKSLEIVISKLD
ncbi:MAG: ATP-dependent RecD-like DNA helicase [Lachnospiraceae bacterium]|nr:ATP-dependent RecD-like DNA helicase [Lachnospiraceae bacterium]